MGRQDPRPAEGDVRASGVQEMAQVEECVKGVECACAVAEEGDVRYVQVLEKRGHEVDPGLKAERGIYVGGPAEAGPVRVDDTDVVLFGQLIFGHMQKTTVISSVIGIR